MLFIACLFLGFAWDSFFGFFFFLKGGGRYRYYSFLLFFSGFFCICISFLFFFFFFGRGGGGGWLGFFSYFLFFIFRLFSFTNWGQYPQQDSSEKGSPLRALGLTGPEFIPVSIALNGQVTIACYPLDRTLVYRKVLSARSLRDPATHLLLDRGGDQNFVLVPLGF